MNTVPGCKQATTQQTWPLLRHHHHGKHQHWRIEEAFKRLKHRLKLECVSGLRQQALLGKNLVRRVHGRFHPSPARHVKPHPHMAYK